MLGVRKSRVGKLKPTSALAYNWTNRSMNSSSNPSFDEDEDASLLSDRPRSLGGAMLQSTSQTSILVRYGHLIFLLLPISLFVGLFYFLLTSRHSINRSISQSLAPALIKPHCCASPVAPVVYQPRFQIVAVGDSITEYGSHQQYWFSLLSDYYTRRADSFNRGYAGYNTIMLDSLLEQHIKYNLWPYQPIAKRASIQSITQSNNQTHNRFDRLVILFMGTNDASLPNAAGNESRLHVPIDQFETKLKSIIRRLVPEYVALSDNQLSSSYPSANTALLLITPGQVNISAWKWRRMTPPLPDLSSLPTGRSNEMAKRYANIVLKIGQQWSIPVIDLFPLTDVNPSTREWDIFYDGLHFNEKGNQIVFHAIVNSIVQNYPSINASVLSMDAPFYHELDYSDLPANFAVG